MALGKSDASASSNELDQPSTLAEGQAFILDVLIPHYRDPEGLKQSLASVAGQTWRGRLRVVVVDDGSPPEEFEQVRAHCEAFQATSGFALTLLRNEVNLGRPRTRNRLLDAVEASHVAWLDAEDIWYPDKLKIQFDHLARLAYEGYDLDTIWVTCSYDWSSNGRTRRRSQETRGDQLQALLIGEDLRAYLWTLLGTAQSFRIAGRFDERLPRMQDLDYFVTFSRGGGQITSPPKAPALCCYFKSDVSRSAADVRDCYKLILAKNAPALHRYPAGLTSLLHYKANRLGARFAFANGQRWKAMTYSLQAVLGSPRHMARVLRNHLPVRLGR